MRTLCTTTILLSTLACITGSAIAQAYPTKPIRFIVPFPPGGGNDVMARIIGQKFTDAFGQQVVIDNRGGAGGNIGTETAARAAPDGYTLFLGGVGSLGTNPGLHAKLPYDPLNDFAPVSQIASASLVVVAHMGLQANSSSSRSRAQGRSTMHRRARARSRICRWSFSTRWRISNCSTCRTKARAPR